VKEDSDSILMMVMSSEIERCSILCIHFVMYFSFMPAIETHHLEYDVIVNLSLLHIKEYKRICSHTALIMNTTCLS